MPVQAISIHSHRFGASCVEKNIPQSDGLEVAAACDHEARGGERPA
jgi:hypothetical protein